MARLTMIVAHPDDETLWGGAYILRHPGDWLVQCCSVPVSDPVRAIKFHEACKRLGATGFVLPNRDEYGSPLADLTAIHVTDDAVPQLYGLSLKNTMIYKFDVDPTAKYAAKQVAEHSDFGFATTLMASP